LGTSLGVVETGAVLALRLSVRAGHTVQGPPGVSPDVLLPAFRERLLFLAALALLTARLPALRGATAPTGSAPRHGGSAGPGAQASGRSSGRHGPKGAPSSRSEVPATVRVESRSSWMASWSPAKVQRRPLRQPRALREKRAETATPSVVQAVNVQP